MFIATKDTKVTAIHETEWQCRRHAKGLDKPAYWTWLESVTTEDENGVKTYDFSGEDYEIVEVNNTRSYESKEIDDKGNPIVVLVWVDTLSYESKNENGDIITIPFTTSGHIVSDLEGTHYHLKWDGSKIIKDDDALTAYQTADKWKNVRADRNRRLAETDYLALSDQTLSAGMKTYRQKLRDVPKNNSDPDKITWPTKP
tara:strand:+ start:474 stop:1073 length:600 start_codon:yes stop_codon:yes gene_type:complete